MYLSHQVYGSRFAIYLNPDHLTRTTSIAELCRTLIYPQIIFRTIEQETSVNDSLTKDEYDALGEISQPKKQERVSACVARNTKRLSGLKYVTYSKNGQLMLTEKGQQTLFLKRCIDGLRAVAADPLAKLDADVTTFLGKKGHIAPASSGQGFELTQRGRESLDDIDAR